MAPALRPLFPADLTSLQGHFEAALALVVRNLEDMAVLQESLRDLGVQHVHWGAKPQDYFVVREALVRAIRSRVQRRGARSSRATGAARSRRLSCRCCKAPRCTPPSSPRRWRAKSSPATTAPE